MKDFSDTGSVHTTDYRIGEAVPRSALAAADGPLGRFETTGHDDRGRATSIEGWFDVHCEKARDQSELDSQKATREAAGNPKGCDASHIAPHGVGGRGPDNLVMMSDTMNRSYYKSVESEAIREAKSASEHGESVYLKATVTWGVDEHTPQNVRYEVFRGARDSDSLTKVQDNEIRTGWDHEKPLNQVLLDGPDEGTPHRNRDWTSATDRPDMTMH